MARLKRKHGGDSEVALADKERDTSVVTGLVFHVVDPAVDSWFSYLIAH